MQKNQQGDGRMRILKCAMAFVLAFCLLAVTVVCSAVATPDMIALTKSSDVDENIEPYIDLKIIEQGDSTYAARMHAPKLDNPYYYSNKNVFYNIINNLIIEQISDNFKLKNCIIIINGY